jgi:hypothetical protein
MAVPIVAGLLLAHGLIHAAYLSPRPPAKAGGPAWPFELNRSWVLGPLGFSTQSTRTAGVGLVAATIAAFALACVGTLGVGPAALWTGSIVIGALASLATLALYFHPWLVLGVAIDIAILWAVALAGWAPSGVGA